MHKHHGLFITGTDTDIGKTHVSRILADTLSLTHKTTYMKAVQTGCTRHESGVLRAPDYYKVMAGSARVNGSYEQHVPYRYEPACSPHLAATLAGDTISFSHIRECCFSIGTGMDITIVEGAGGVLAPLSETTYMIDLMVHLSFPVILVTAARLGTLNHTFLSLRVLHDSGVKVAGVVFNNCRKTIDRTIFDDNRRMIHSHVHPIPFLELPYNEIDAAATKDFCDAISQHV